jgi:hypothetical protein
VGPQSRKVPEDYLSVTTSRTSTGMICMTGVGTAKVDRALPSSPALLCGYLGLS